MKQLFCRLLACTCSLPLLLSGADWAETIRPVLAGKVKYLKLEKKSTAPTAGPRSPD